MKTHILSPRTWVTLLAGLPTMKPRLPEAKPRGLQLPRTLASVFAVAVAAWGLSGSNAGAIDYAFTNSIGFYVDGTNWSPNAPAGGPQLGDTATVDGTKVVQVGAATDLTNGAAIILKDSCVLQRNSNAQADMSGTITFTNSSGAEFSRFTVKTNGVLNWHSTGTFSRGTNDLGTQAAFTMEQTTGVTNLLVGGTVNMSAGFWNLDSSVANAMELNSGTFNMTGGTISNAPGKGFRMGTGSSVATFNLGGTGALYCTNFSVFAPTGTNSVFNFQGTNSALYCEGTDSAFITRLGLGHIHINGVKTTNLTDFTTTVIGSYTQIKAIPRGPTAYTFKALVGSYSVGTSWSPTALTGGPQLGDTATVDGTKVCTVSAQTTLTTGAAITLKDSSVLQRSSSAAADMSGTITFNNSSAAEFSVFKVKTNGVLNWHSTGTFSRGLLAVSTAQAAFTMQQTTGVTNLLVGGTVNMSAGFWSLESSASAAVAMDLRSGTFNMTGGTISNAPGKAFKLGTGSSVATFNLGGTGALYCTNFQCFAPAGMNSVFNFQGTNSALYCEGTASAGNTNALYYFVVRINNGHVFIDGVKQTSLANFTVSEIGGYTQIKVGTASQPNPTNITYTVSGSELVLNWPAGQGWNLQAQTNNLNVGITTNWSTISGATPPFTNAIDPANPTVFYRLKY